MWMDDLERLRATGADVADLKPLHYAAASGRGRCAVLVGQGATIPTCWMARAARYSKRQLGSVL